MGDPTNSFQQEPQGHRCCAKRLWSLSWRKASPHLWAFVFSHHHQSGCVTHSDLNALQKQHHWLLHPYQEIERSCPGTLPLPSVTLTHLALQTQPCIHIHLSRCHPGVPHVLLSAASGNEVLEVPNVEMVAPVRPSAASQRAGFVVFDQWDLGEMFAHRQSLMGSVPRFSRGSFRVAIKVAFSWSSEKECAPTSKSVEALVDALQDAAPTSQRRTNQQGQVDCSFGQV